MYKLLADFALLSVPIATYPTILPVLYYYGKQLPLISMLVYDPSLAFESGIYTCGVNFMTRAGE